MKKLFGPLALVAAAGLPVEAAPRTNVLIVITDDQGYGDLGCHGNPVLKTPNLDAFAKQSTQLTHFYVSPGCSPTRSSLLTGRYTPTSEGHWDVVVERTGTYGVTLDFEAAKEDCRAAVILGRTTSRADVRAGRSRVVVQVPTDKGEANLEAWVEGKERVGVKFAEVERFGD